MPCKKTSIGGQAVIEGIVMKGPGKSALATRMKDGSIDVECAYTYLPQSIKAFPQGEIMREIILKAGFSKADFKRLTLGICTLYTATK